jgi:peptide chain release factor 1
MKKSGIIDRFKHELERFSWIENELASPATASQPGKYKELNQEHSRLTPRVEKIQRFLKIFQDLADAESILADKSADGELRNMAQEDKIALEQELEQASQQIEELLLPPDPNDGKGLIFEIRAGTGGEEAALFASELFRMYLRFAEQSGLKSEIIYINEAEMGGLKEATFSISGNRAHALLHQEAGTHRVQRIPVTESGGRIHTSAVTVSVMVEAEEEEYEINEGDLQIDVFRASGAGGQHVNKTESAVRITHIPTGVVVSCQDERSQLKNKARAMKVLRSRLANLQKERAHQEQAQAKKQQVGSGDRSEKIRTYNFPQGRVTDHRINYSMYNLPEFMNGEIAELLDALLKAEREQKMQAAQV